MHRPAPTVAPPDCDRCGADDELIPCIDPGGSVLLCRLCVIALVGGTDAQVAVLLDVPPIARWVRCWFCGGSGKDPRGASACRICGGGGQVNAAAAEPWERGDDRTDASGPDLPDWPEEKEQ